MQHIAPIARCMASARQETLNSVSRASRVLFCETVLSTTSQTEPACTLLAYGSVFTRSPSPRNPPKRYSVDKVLSI